MSEQTMIQPNPLTNLKETIRTHWQEHRPKMVAELKASGQLEEAIAAAERLTVELVYQMVAATGCSIREAWMEVREQHAILPAETDEDEMESETVDPLAWIEAAAALEETDEEE